MWGTSPYVCGAAATVTFYLALPQLPVSHDLAERYFCAHPVEYVQTALFFTGLCLLIWRVAGLRVERAAVRSCTSGGDERDLAGSDGADSAQQIVSAHATRLSGPEQQTAIAARLRDVGLLLTRRPSRQAFESQLKDLDVWAREKLYNGAALQQAIHWAIPIMGILATIVGITAARFHLGVNHVDVSLSDVTFNLPAAFDPAAIALCYSLSLVFLSHIVMRAEEGTLAQINEYMRRRLLPLLPTEAQAGPLADAEAAAARELVDWTGEMIDSHTRQWTDSIESLRQRWTETLRDQQQSLAQALATGTGATLGQHAQLLSDLRGEFVHALEQITRQRTEAEAQLRAQQTALINRWEHGTQQLAATLGQAQQAADERTAKLLTEFATQLSGWKADLKSATGALAGHAERMARLEEALCDAVERGDNILSLERGLNSNLETLRATEAFEQTMHSLSAAVHLLTAYARQRAA
ncbi:MAG: hypothetical protein U0992_02070 [Planctomycetaceae bacterium]